MNRKERSSLKKKRNKDSLMRILQFQMVHVGRINNMTFYHIQILMSYVN